MKELGAVRAIDYLNEDFADYGKQHGGGFDMVVETIGKASMKPERSGDSRANDRSHLAHREHVGRMPPLPRDHTGRVGHHRGALAGTRGVDRWMPAWFGSRVLRTLRTTSRRRSSPFNPGVTGSWQ